MENFQVIDLSPEIDLYLKELVDEYVRANVRTPSTVNSSNDVANNIFELRSPNCVPEPLDLPEQGSSSQNSIDRLFVPDTFVEDLVDIHLEPFESDGTLSGGILNEIQDEEPYSKIKFVSKNNHGNFRSTLLKSSAKFEFQNVVTEADLKTAIEELIEYIRKEHEDADLLGLTFKLTNDALDSGIYISPRRMDQLEADLVLEQYEMVCQSERSFESFGQVEITIDKIYKPRGAGRIDLLRPSMKSELVKFRKKSLIFSNDYQTPGGLNCLAIAIAIGIAHLSKVPFPKGGRRSDQFIFSQMIRKKAEKIENLSEVNFSELSHIASLDELEKVQRVLWNFSGKAFRIVVFDKKADVLFVGTLPELSSEIKNINILHDDNHFDYIRSLTGVFAKNYFCDFCHSGFASRSAHKNCKFTCTKCFENPPCQTVVGNFENPLSCKVCTRTFYNEKCFTNHLGSICAKVQICKFCSFPKGKNHICGRFYCRLCKAIKDFDHTCFIPVYEPPKPSKKLKHAYIFYDFESLIEPRSDGSFEHVVNLCVSNITCDSCEDNDENTFFCDFCGERERVFRFSDENQYSALDDFLAYVCDMEKIFKITMIAHNGSNYDTILLARRIFDKMPYVKPQLITNGTKIYVLSFGRVRVIDSCNFVMAPLAKIPTMFGLTDVGCKGYFPHLFNTRQNQSFVGAYPARDFYGVENMKSDDLIIFDEWYESVKSEEFNFQTEIVKYCKQDVIILRKFCLKLSQQTYLDSGIMIFREALTIASFVSKVFRKNFYKGNIALIPKNGYRMAEKQSFIALLYLRNLEENVYHQKIMSAFNGLEKVIRSGKARYKVDGYLERTIKNSEGLDVIEKIVFDFHGCYFHDHFCLNKSLTTAATESEIADHNAKYLRRETTARKTQALRNLGYTVIEKWECEFREELKRNPDIYAFGDEIRESKLDPRAAFYGGNTDCAAVYYKAKPGEQIKYYDFCSLYPSVNKFSKQILGAPTEIIIGEKNCRNVELSGFEGLIKCRVLPPQSLFHPVLPLKMNGKLLFPLCYTCAKESLNEDCTHPEKLRTWVGTYVADELKRGLELGYKILTFYEMWRYNVVTGLFADFVTHYQTEKLYASGLPSGVDDANVDVFLKAYELREGLKLDKNKFSKNPSKRAFSKVILNSLWGKMGQTERPQTRIITTSDELFKLLANSQIVIKSFHIINEVTLVVNFTDEDAAPLNTVNVVVAAYTTACARLKLHNLLHKAGNQLLYFDTDSIIFKQSNTQPPLFETGVFLGDLTDEVEVYGKSAYITEFVSCGPKSYAYKVYNPETNEEHEVCKVKGLTLNHQNKKIVNFEAMKKQILESAPDQLSVTSTMFIRDKNFAVRTLKRKKQFRSVINKRRLIGYVTYPYGYRI